MNPPAQPLLLRIKRNSLDDGPGIRTVVFFKGCPLSCDWCHNPESKRAKPELSHDPDVCVSCGKCVEACLRNAISGPPIKIDRGRCERCFSCVGACPSHALECLGEPAKLDPILDIIRRDTPFFRTSGGVTLSGGEPTLYMEFAGKLLNACRDLGVHTLLETCGHFDLRKFRDRMLPWIDTIYYDVKIINDESHKKHCGVTNEKILSNLKLLIEEAKSGEFSILPRIPLVHGITATDENLAAISDFLRAAGASRVALLPYNPTWLKKPAMIGDAPNITLDAWMPASEIERCKSFFKDFEIAEN